jgi:hypothetical protein
LTYNGFVVYRAQVEERTIRPMRVVLGGIPPLEDIVGRESETAAVLDSLRGHGALLTGDRRHGKTCLTRLVEVASVKAGQHVVRVSAERRSFGEFVEALADALSFGGSALRNEVDRWRVSLKAGPLSAERAQASARSLDTLVETVLAARPDRLLVLCFDEIPVLAKAMEEQELGSGADLLHLLRRLRQEHSGRLAMVLSGSIGFHHITADALGATNDVEKLAVGPLGPVDAVYLARCLLQGEGVSVSDEAEVARAIADAAECVPYYVHQLVRSSRNRTTGRDGTVNPDDIPRLVDAALTDPDDPWDLRHYRDRVPNYYGTEQESTVSAILDVYADVAGVVEIDEVRRRLESAELDSRPGRPALVRLVERLEADHYLLRIGAGSRFASDLVRRAWLAHRRR